MNSGRNVEDNDDIALDTNVFNDPVYSICDPTNEESLENQPSTSTIEETEISIESRSNEATDEERNITNNTNNSISSNLDQINSNHPRHVLKKYSLTYELEEYSRNILLIFNHEEFFSSKIRHGTMKDEEALTNTFKKFGFRVQSYLNLKREKLLDTIKQFAKKTDFSTFGCICIAILTHGAGTGSLQAWDTSYHEHEVLELFDAHINPTLVAKPIVILIEACRGPQPASAVIAGRPTSRDLEYDSGGKYELYSIPLESDRLIFHSSYVGRASVRSKSNGSFFIQTLCSMINMHSATCHLEEIFLKVKMAVALDSADWIEDADKVPKQMPVVSTSLIRKIYLRPYASGQQEILSKDEVDTADLSLASMKISDGECNNNPPSNASSPTVPLLPNMPCSCFLEYFIYLRSCLRLFTTINPHDPSAKMLLGMVEKVEDGVENIYLKLNLIENIWDFLNANSEKFPYDYVYRSYY